MVSGIHALIYTKDPDGVRAFLRDVLGFPYIDAHDGWLIFALPLPSWASTPLTTRAVTSCG